MNKIIVTYDLCGNNKNYDGLIKRLEKFPSKLKLNKSSWLIETKFNCIEVRDILLKEIDSNDLLFVAKLSGEAAWHNSISNSSDIKTLLEK